ncbi:hypothetical protein V6N13_118593 [Hibiscus sabdariffa]
MRQGFFLRHQAITIVEEEDGRAEGNGPVARAGLKGVGKKKVHFKKKPDLRIPDRVLPSYWTDIVNIRSDTPRRRAINGDDVTEKPLDDSRLAVGTSLEEREWLIWCTQMRKGIMSWLWVRFLITFLKS